MIHPSTRKPLGSWIAWIERIVGENDFSAIVLNLGNESGGITHVFKDSAANDIIILAGQSRIDAGIEITKYDFRGASDNITGLIFTARFQIIFEKTRPGPEIENVAIFRN